MLYAGVDRCRNLSILVGLVGLALDVMLVSACSSSDSGNVNQAGGSPGGGVAETGGASGRAGSTVDPPAGGDSGGKGSGGDVVTTGGRRGSGGRIGSGGNANASGGRTGAAGTTAGTSVASTGGAAGSAGAGPDAGSAGGAAGTPSTGVGGAIANPTQCSGTLPAGAQPVDVSKPASVVGNGTADGCSFSALSTAVAKGGIITFNCGSGPVTIPVTATLKPPTSVDTVIDGGKTITLDGQGKVQILNFTHGDFMKSETRVTLQHLALINGKTTPKEAIPTAPAPCSQGYNDGEGGAIYMLDGNLTVIDCTFSGNQGAPRGPDTGGGAIYITGSKHGALIVGSTFTGNSAANAGAIGGLFATLEIYNSVFRNNKATGDGANNDDPSKCSVINNDQNEVGSGGNGGAIYQDGGDATNIVLCGVDVENNAAGTGAFGGGVFMTSNDWSGTITIKDSIIKGNTGGSWTQVNSGPDLGSAFGVNAKSSSIVNSTLQGVK